MPPRCRPQGGTPFVRMSPAHVFGPYALPCPGTIHASPAVFRGAFCRCAMPDPTCGSRRASPDVRVCGRARGPDGGPPAATPGHASSPGRALMHSCAVTLSCRHTAMPQGEMSSASTIDTPTGNVVQRGIVACALRPSATTTRHPCGWRVLVPPRHCSEACTACPRALSSPTLSEARDDRAWAPTETPSVGVYLPISVPKFRLGIYVLYCRQLFDFWREDPAEELPAQARYSFFKE